MSPWASYDYNAELMSVYGSFASFRQYDFYEFLVFDLRPAFPQRRNASLVFEKERWRYKC